MNKVEERVKQILEEWEKELKEFTWNDSPDDGELCLEFKADPHSKVGFGKDDPMDQVYFNISKHDEDDEDEFHEAIYEARFKIFELLENMARIVCQENTDKDSCSFEYQMDLQVSVIDYFS